MNLQYANTDLYWRSLKKISFDTDYLSSDLIQLTIRHTILLEFAY